MGRYERHNKQSARMLLWGGREAYLEMILEDIPVYVRAIESTCRLAGWTFDSYFLAVFFDCEALLEEVSQ